MNSAHRLSFLHRLAHVIIIVAKPHTAVVDVFRSFRCQRIEPAWNPSRIWRRPGRIRAGKHPPSIFGFSSSPMPAVDATSRYPRPSRPNDMAASNRKGASYVNSLWKSRPQIRVGRRGVRRKIKRKARSEVDAGPTRAQSITVMRGNQATDDFSLSASTACETRSDRCARAIVNVIRRSASYKAPAALYCRPFMPNVCWYLPSQAPPC